MHNNIERKWNYTLIFCVGLFVNIMNVINIPSMAQTLPTTERALYSIKIDNTASKIDYDISPEVIINPALKTRLTPDVHLVGKVLLDDIDQRDNLEVRLPQQVVYAKHPETNREIKLDLQGVINNEVLGSTYKPIKFDPILNEAPFTVDGYIDPASLTGLNLDPGGYCYLDDIKLDIRKIN